MNAKNDKSPVPAVARERDSAEQIVTLTGGVRARIMPVPASLIDEVANRIPDPEVPVWNNPDRVSDEYPEGRPEPNPSDPKYLQEIEAINRKKGLAAIDAMSMFGLELLDPIPTTNENGGEANWISKLRFMAKRGQFDLDQYDLDDPMELEFVWKRFIAADTNVLTMIQEASGIGPADVERAERSFRRSKERRADSGDSG